jgi:hypothetical protein
VSDNDTAETEAAPKKAAPKRLGLSVADCVSIRSNSSVMRDYPKLANAVRAILADLEARA